MNITSLVKFEERMAGWPENEKNLLVLLAATLGIDVLIFMKIGPLPIVSLIDVLRFSIYAIVSLFCIIYLIFNRTQFAMLTVFSAIVTFHRVCFKVYWVLLALTGYLVGMYLLIAGISIPSWVCIISGAVLSIGSYALTIWGKKINTLLKKSHAGSWWEAGNIVNPLKESKPVDFYSCKTALKSIAIFFLTVNTILVSVSTALFIFMDTVGLIGLSFLLPLLGLENEPQSIIDSIFYNFSWSTATGFFIIIIMVIKESFNCYAFACAYCLTGNTSLSDSDRKDNFKVIEKYLYVFAASIVLFLFF